MNALAYLLIGVAKILHLLISIYTFVVAFSVLLSWVSPDPRNTVVHILRSLTEPVFWQVRRILPRVLFRTGIDFSPIIVLFILILLDTVAVQLLYDLAHSLLRDRM